MRKKRTAAEKSRYDREYNNWYRGQFREKVNRASRDSLRRLRTRVIEALGGKCRRCGFSDPRALQADHPKGGGCRDRRKKSISAYYHYILKHKNEFQLLCANCNWIKRAENDENHKPDPATPMSPAPTPIYKSKYSELK